MLPHNLPILGPRRKSYACFDTLAGRAPGGGPGLRPARQAPGGAESGWPSREPDRSGRRPQHVAAGPGRCRDRKSTRLNSSHVESSYAVFCLKKKKETYSMLQLKTNKNEQMKHP